VSEKNVLKEDMARLRAEKSDKLEQQLLQIHSYQKELEEGKKLYEQAIADSSLDVHTRKKRIITLVSELTGRKDIQLMLATQPKLRLGFETQMLTTFLDQLAINDCDQPTTPLVKLTKVNFDSVILELQCDDDVLVHKATEFWVEVALIHTSLKQKAPKRIVRDNKKKKKKEKGRQR